MADPDNKQPESAAGKYYVDTECIDCDVCRQTAPEVFLANEDGGYAYVAKQPENDDEVAQCEEALEACPVEAIGNDGE
ncbi:MAG: ferredoxin [Planctomycetes bacterium]|nr:ferredoxin [Planctomycetota bacterium]